MTIEDMGDRFDEMLLDMLQNGRETMDRDGNLVRVQPTSADLNVIRQRLKDCGMTSVPVEDSPIANIVAEMAKRRLPDLNDDSDFATG
jgi:hypothetical protein